MRLRMFSVLALSVMTSALLASPSRAATPIFQALGYSRDLAVTAPDKLLTAATIIKADANLPAVFYSSMARDPVSGKIFIVGMQISTGDSYLGQVDFVTGAEKTIGRIPRELVGGLAFDAEGHLFGLATPGGGSPTQALLSIDPRTAAASILKVLDLHGGDDNVLEGALAWNPADGLLYYANRDGDSRLFVDRLESKTFNQASVLKETWILASEGMFFMAGRLWMTDGIFISSADAKNISQGFTTEGHPTFQTADGMQDFLMRSIVPFSLSCTPSSTTACLHNRFKVEVAYDARPQSGSGPGSVVLESRETVKFGFFSSGSIELIVKIVNNCSSPLKKWRIFVGGLTTVGVSLKVTDTLTGSVKSYSSQNGRLFQSVSDTFPCP
jgi:hypothetical protein